VLALAAPCWCGKCLAELVCGGAPSRRTPPPPAPPGLREHYGPPPGAARALSHYELGDRGWPSYPWEYNANTASAISHMIERSA
jgi:hypothetical protein